MEEKSIQSSTETGEIFSSENDGTAGQKNAAGEAPIDFCSNFSADTFDFCHHGGEKEYSSTEVKFLLERRISELEMEKIRSENCALLERIGKLEGEKMSLMNVVNANVALSGELKETNTRLVEDVRALNEKIHGLFRELIAKDAEERGLCDKLQKVCADFAVAEKTIEQLTSEKHNTDEESLKTKLSKTELDLQNVLEEKNQLLELKRKREGKLSALETEKDELEKKLAKVYTRIRFPHGVYFLRPANSGYLTDNVITGQLVVSPDKKERFKLSYLDNNTGIFTLFSIDANKIVGWRDGLGIGLFANTLRSTNAEFEIEEINSEGALTIILVNYHTGRPRLTLGTGLSVSECDRKGTKFFLEPEQ